MTGANPKLPKPPRGLKYQPAPKDQKQYPPDELNAERDTDPDELLTRIRMYGEALRGIRPGVNRDYYHQVKAYVDLVDALDAHIVADREPPLDWLRNDKLYDHNKLRVRSHEGLQYFFQACLEFKQKHPLWPDHIVLLTVLAEHRPEVYRNLGELRRETDMFTIVQSIARLWDY